MSNNSNVENIFSTNGIKIVGCIKVIFKRGENVLCNNIILLLKTIKQSVLLSEVSDPELDT